MHWKNLSIQTKILIICGSIMACFIATIFFYVMPTVEKNIYDLKKEKIKDIVDTTVTTIEGMYQDSLDKKIKEEDLKKNVVEYVKRIRYGNGGKDYVWINDFVPVMIMHPYKPEMNGQSLMDYKDPNGKRIFVEFADLCRSRGAGYVTYVWQYKDDTSRLETKISYVRAVHRLDWIIGTGVYEADIRSEISARVRSMQINLAIVFACITVVMVLCVVLLSRNIKKNIELCVDFARKLADGNLQERIELDQKDEIGSLAGTLNLSVNDLENLVSGVILSSQNLAQAVEQISIGNQNLSQRTSEQASSLEEIASTIEQATATIRQSSENTGEASRSSDEVSRIITGAKDLSNKAIELAEQGGLIVVKAVDSITDINRSSEKIGEILKVINDIAFQTNLLALNAAVEAARAGDHGRGFAVVAGEVRNLAQRSAAAANEIAVMIRDSTDKVRTGTEMVNRSGESLTGIIESVRKTDDALSTVMVAVGRVNGLVSEIDAACGEQRQGIEQINMAVTEMDVATQQNAALVEETASASEEMANQAQDLLTLVKNFTIREGYGDAAIQVKKDDGGEARPDGGNGNSRGRKNAVTNGEPAKRREGNGGGRKPVILTRPLTAAGEQHLSTIMRQDGFEEM
jgi:methyl-accepting chemotaxis protein